MEVGEDEVGAEVTEEVAVLREVVEDDGIGRGGSARDSDDE